MILAGNKSIPMGFLDLKGGCFFECSLIFFWAAYAPTFANLSASSFWVIPQCAGEYVTLKEKHFNELVMCIISSILS